MKTDGNLHIESQQYRDIYRQKATNKGVGIGVNTSGQRAGNMGVSGGKTRGDTYSNYESVTSQASMREKKDSTSQSKEIQTSREPS